VKTAILIFDGFTALDAIGPYEVLRSVPGWEVEFVAAATGEKRTEAARSGSAPTARSRTPGSPTWSSSPAAPATGRC
jgi:putative intracellular protease/amidase